MSRVAVIGAGPAGMLAAAYAARNGHGVDCFERNEKTGKKLFLTGKGRCNITNLAEKREFLEHVPRNPKFLHSALARFFHGDIVELLHAEGVPTTVERGGRVFPLSGKSSDVIRALTAFARAQGVDIHLHARVEALEMAPDGGFLLRLPEGSRRYDAVVLATGGLSYEATGSTGDGYAFARALGHRILDPKPSLIPFLTRESWPGTLAGLSLKNVALRARRGKKKLLDEVGELLFTHHGIGGPLVLSASSLVADDPAGVALEIDLKPGLAPEALDARLLRDLAAHPQRQMVNALVELLPRRLIPVVLDLARIPEDKPAAELTRPERQGLVAILKALPLTVSGTAPLDQAVITRGGVDVREVDSSTMESRLVKGLYFAGEILDVDAMTGGYNLQIAYSTGVLAGSSIP